MALKIRLRRMGRKKAPHYRIVVAESSMPRDGRFVAKVGHYNPTTTPATLVVDRDKALAWMAKGAMPTETVQSLLKKAGVFNPAPSVVEQATEAVAGTAKKAAKAVSGAASGAASAVSSAASAVSGAVASAAVAGAARDVVENVTERVSGGSDEAPAAEASAPVAEEAPAAEPTASADEVVAEEAEATEPTTEATAPAGAEDAPATDTPVATDAEATEPAADEPQA
jgi:small subunit ribosomal protein S16